MIVALGSNTLPLQHLAQAQRLLREHFSGIRFSSSLQTEAIGIQSPPFLNAIGIATTPLQAAQANAILKSIEQECGNDKALRQQGKIVIDIDLLLHGDTVFHPSDWQRDYIRTLLGEMGLSVVPTQEDIRTTIRNKQQTNEKI